MKFFADLWANTPLICAAVSWTIAQLIKVMISLALDKKNFDWKRIFGMGGMPSSHTAFVFSLALMTGIRESFSSTYFALAFALAAVVIYDAMGVRRETGRQGAVLNEIISQVLVEGKPITEQQLKELVGHSPLEVAAGILLASIVTLVMTLLA